MYTEDDIKQIHRDCLRYFISSFGYNFISLTKEEIKKIDKCGQAMHNARLLYDIKYFNFYKDKK